MNKARVTRQLASDEGYRGQPYRDSEGNWTIGFGHNLDAAPLTRSQCRFILKDDVAIAVEDCERFIGFFTIMAEPRQEVLVNMMFNLGWPKLKKFVKMHQALRVKDWSRAADEMLDSKWARQVKIRATNLAATMRSGIYEEVKR
jgi:lysozyme